MRNLGPLLQLLDGPRCSLVRVAGIARVRHLELIRHRRWDEFEGMAANVDIGNRLLDLRHVAANTFVAG